jgi:hypothetical protein
VFILAEMLPVKAPAKVRRLFNLPKQYFPIRSIGKTDLKSLPGYPAGYSTG